MSVPSSQSAPLSMDNPAAIAHINQLQTIVTRLATQSASCKTLCLSMISAFIAFAGVTKLPLTASFTLLPILLFGFLDTMYLAQEKAYRDQQEKFVCKLHAGTYLRSDVFKLDASIAMAHVRSAIGSWSILPVYGLLLIAYTIFMGWLNLPALVTHG